MKKTKKIVLMLCLILFGAFCFAYGEARMVENRDGIPIGVIQRIIHGGSDRSSNIVPTLNGHVLSVVFNENMGQVSVEVATSSGATVDCLSVLTPNGVQVYIPNSGNYIVTFTFSDGDVYYGEFSVTD